MFFCLCNFKNWTLIIVILDVVCKLISVRTLFALILIIVIFQGRWQLKNNLWYFHLFIYLFIIDYKINSIAYMCLKSKSFAGGIKNLLKKNIISNPYFYLLTIWDLHSSSPWKVNIL